MNMHRLNELFISTALALVIIENLGYAEQLFIKREKGKETLVTFLNNVEILKLKCSLDYVILWKDGEHRCIKKSEVEDSMQKNNKTTDCIYESVPSICEMVEEIPVVVQSFENEVRKDQNLTCINLSNTVSAKVANNSCGKDVSVSGILLKMNIKCANKTMCMVFSLPGKTVNNLNSNSTLITNSSTTAMVANTTTGQPSTSNTTISTMKATTKPSQNITQLLPKSSTNTLNVISTKSTEKKLISTVVTMKTTTIRTYVTFKRNDEDEWTTKKLMLYIVLPILFVLIIIGCLIYYYCRRRCQKERKNTLPLLEINSGEEVIDEPLYTTPNKQKMKKKQKREKDEYKEGVLPKSTWPDYDEVGVMIEGTYEKRESLLLDENTQFGVSAKLLQDDNTAVANLSTSYGEDDDPYEKLGRCNSFTPKTKAEKNKLHKEKIENENNKADSNQEEERKTEEENQEENELPYVGKSGTPLRMSSFKPGLSMRKKQQRTSMKRPKTTDDTPASSETHEDVTITPQPSKKHLLVLDTVPIVPSLNGSFESIPNGIEPKVENENKENKKDNYADIVVSTNDTTDPVIKPLDKGTGNYTDVIIDED